VSEIDETGHQKFVPDQDLIRISPRGEMLSPFLILLLYSRGTFPFLYDKNHSLWWSPEPRSVLVPSEVHISRSLRKTLHQGRYHVTADVAFKAVVRACREVLRGPAARLPLEKKQRLKGTSWINDEIEKVFSTLHRLGHAHSVEVWSNDELVGGLYGVALGQLFVGCSMFHVESDASKVALVKLTEKLPALGISLVDCQLHNPHLQRLGARLIPREEFVGLVARLSRGRRSLGLWTEAFAESAPRLGV
jgi:leucyl/phenylalanyl-tRNA--protein transferase